MATDDQFRDALERLPVPYAVALRLREARIPNGVIAECIGVEPEALPVVFLVAETKLAAIMATRKS
ncbi:MAG: hypothetical protein ACRD6I_13480 [Candidatus Acidiferrales bacterium]